MASTPTSGTASSRTS
jgi:hypothetical protein